MKMSFRWFGLNDAIPLKYIKQIPNMHSVVTAVYGVKVGEKWPIETLKNLKEIVNKNGLAMEVIESIPVHEDIKLGKPTRDGLIENYIENIRRCAEVGIKVICYNFMPVFDWLRTTLSFQNNDGSNSLAYLYEDFQKIDAKNLSLPGWDESYTKNELTQLLDDYKSVTHEKLFDNLKYFLMKIIPVCEEVAVKMAIHPDDPPWDIFGLPRIVSSEENLDRIFAAVPSLYNGVTLCTGSFGAGRFNDLPSMARKYAARIHFAHLRNICYLDDKGSFKEVSHLSSDGSLDMAKIVDTLVEYGFDGYVRPDHGRNIFGEQGKPGYGLFDRALGVAYINGLFEMTIKKRNNG